MQQLRRLKDLGEFTLTGTDGEVGSLQQIFFDDRDWRIRYLIVRAGTWLLGREVLLIPELVTEIDDGGRRIQVAATCERIRQAPPVTAQLTVSRHYEQALHQHYGALPYWDDDLPTGVPAPVRPATIDSVVDEPVNPYLRSSREVTGYSLSGVDGEVGEVRDFVIDAPGWHLRYLVIRTGGWLRNRDILVACAWLEGIDWSAGRVATVLSRKAIESAPSYDTRRDIGRDYELALYKHYGRHFDDGD